MNTIIKKNFSKQTVAFFGLGNMGIHMANNLLKKGFAVAGFDAVKDVQTNFAKKEGALNLSLSDAVQKADYVVSMLPQSHIVEAVWRDVCGNKPKKGSIIVDSSTISPIDAKKYAAMAKNEGLRPADAPVSGGTSGAENGILTFMVGTEEAYFEDIKAFLSNGMGKNIFHCGHYGDGQAFKVINNLMLGINQCGLSEGMALAKSLGVDIKKLTEVISVSSGNSKALDVYHPVPGINPNVSSSRNYDKGFNTELMLKDMKLAIEVSKQQNADHLMMQACAKYYDILAEQELGKKDFSIVYDYMIKKNKF